MTRGEIWSATLDPAGRPEADAIAYWLVVSPSELCEQLDVVTVLPLKPGASSAGFRIPVAIDGREHRVLLEQITTLDKQRLRRARRRARPQGLGESARHPARDVRRVTVHGLITE